MTTQVWKIKKRASGRGLTTKSDFRASLTTCRSTSHVRDRQQIGLRLSRFLMRRVGWQPGDFVEVTLHSDGRYQLDRTSDQSEGFRLSRNGKSADWSSCSVKFAPTQEQCLAMFPNGVKSRDCVVIDATPSTVVAMYE